MQQAAAPMQIRVMNERFGLRYRPLAVDSQPLQRCFEQHWRHTHPGEAVLPPVISDDFTVHALNAALREAARFADTEVHAPPAEATAEPVTGSSEGAGAPLVSSPISLLELVTRQIDELLEASTMEKALDVTPGKHRTLVGEENASDLATNLFFTLASGAFRVSRAASTAGEIRTLEDHSVLFQRCVAVFKRRYHSHISVHVPPRLSSDELSEAQFTRYRLAVCDAFPTASGGNDAHTPGILGQLLLHAIVPSRGHRAGPPSSAATLSTLTTLRRTTPTTALRPPDTARSAKAATAQAVNEHAMMESERLFPDAEWQADPGPRCPSCGAPRYTYLQWYPGKLQGRPVNCRACGRALCEQCVRNVSHCSFAKLSNPSKPLEGTLRPVCDSCFKKFKGFQHLRFLGSLFIFSGFDFVHLLLSLGVGLGWTAAAELCISDHRFLLHTLSSHAQLALSPMGVLLQNSVHLFLTPIAATASTTASAATDAAIVWHPEALLVLLRFIGEAQLWMRAEVRALVTALSRSRVGGGPPSTGTAQLSHYHMWCTQFCPQMRPFFFYMKAMECIATAPPSCDYAREALLALAARARASIHATQSKSTRPVLLAPPPPRPLSPTRPTLRKSGAGGDDAVGELELMTVWLLDLLQRPRTRDMLTADEAVRQGLPVLVGHRPQLLCWVLSMLQLQQEGTLSATPALPLSQRKEEVETLILEQVPDVAFRTRAKSTVVILKRLDRWVRQRPASRFNVAEICKWFAENFAPVDSADVGFHRSALGTVTQRTLARLRAPDRLGAPVGPADYLDLRAALCDPLHPTETILRAVYLPGMREEKSSLGKQSPVWLCFSSWSREHRALVAASHGQADDSLEAAAETTEAHSETEARSESRQRLKQLVLMEGAEEVRCSFLYKLENVDADNLMCVSFRLLQWLLRDSLDGADIPRYGILPLSAESGLIEKAPGTPLSQVDNLRDYLMKLPDVADPADTAKNFLTSLKLFLLLNHLFGIGDRHKGNVMISPRGAIFHIDFGFVFHKRPRHEMLSPAVRLDRNILTTADACRRLLESSATPPTHTASKPVQPIQPTTGGVDGAALAPGVSTSPTTAHASPSLSPPSSPVGGAKVEDWFCNEVADLLLLVRPHAVLFYHLWIYGVHRCQVLDGSEQGLADYFNRLFDTTAFVDSCRRHFIDAMHQSINKWTLKDNSRSLTYTVSNFLGL